MTFRQQNYIISAVLVLLVGLIYGQCMTHDFVGYDDPLYVTDNPIVQQGLTAHGIAWSFTHSAEMNWTPLAMISHMADVQMFGKKAGAQHLTSVAIHAINSVLLFWMLLVLTQARWPAALVAAIFAVHPLHVESVAWIAERKDVLCAMFFMLAILAYAKYVRGRSIPWYAAVVLLFALGLMSKPMIVTLPAVLILLNYWPLKRLACCQNVGEDAQTREVPQSNCKTRGLGWVLLEMVPLVVIAVADGVITVLCQHSAARFRSLDQFPLSYRISNAIVSYGKYITKTIWPAKLAVFYPAPPSWPMSVIIASAATLVVISAITIFFYRARPYLIVGWLWFLGMLLPVIGLVQVGRQSMADRYAYLPQIGLCIMVAWVLAELVRKHPRYLQMVSLICGIVIALLSVTAFAQVTHWKNTYTLFTHTIDVTGDNALAYNQVGNTLMRQGHFSEAEAYYRRSLDIEPRYPLAQTNLANLLVRKGDIADAIAHYQIAIALPQHPIELSNAYTGLGIALSMSQKYGEADSAFASAVEADQDAPAAHYAWGVSLRARGKETEAEGKFKEALAIDPKFAPARQQLRKTN